MAAEASVRLHRLEAGGGEPVVLLHGFPESSYSWRHQVPALAAAGFRVLAPDLRGYGRSPRPPGIARYRARELLADVARLIREETAGSAHVVGHDWGGVLAWRLAQLFPSLVRRLCILNAPHPAAYRRELGRGLGQWLRSWYALLFQLPLLPEALLRAGDFAVLERAWRTQPLRPGTFTDEDIEEMKSALRGSGLSGPLAWYRAARRFPRDLSDPPQEVSAPTLLVWGERDPYLGVGLAEGLDRWVPGLRIERLADASHWVQNDAHERVSRFLIGFLGGDG
ncbi:MAG: alpha/beta hydrolase [Gemmataceae bacterium]|nr:alpha/beta hydrolase [Gemmataceae bacterium]